MWRYLFPKTRYRKPRFLNRTRPKGWLAPSLIALKFLIILKLKGKSIC
ncbi:MULTISPECIES: RRXRR domain-containing protein [Brasilonema]